jgi:spermidine synthase
MGYTTAAALRKSAADARIEVAELLPAVVAWNRGPLAALAGNPLNDPRVMVREVDIALILRSEKLSYDAILLDVDNGPEGLTRKGNNWLYSSAGLDAAYAALRPAGVLAVWSAGQDQEFSRRLSNARFEVTEVSVRARGTAGGGRHTIWLAVR